MKEYILEIKKFIPEEFCNKIISYFDENNLEVAQTMGGTDRNIRNCELTNILETNTFGKTLAKNFVRSKIFESCKIYKERFPNFSFKEISQCDLLKYTANQYKVGYDFHVDQGFKCERRALSISIVLNNKFQGGEFMFDLPEGNLQLAQNIGDAILFPSNFMFPHKVNKITSGTRYAIVSWVI